MISTGGSFLSVWRMVRFLTTILPKSAERRKPPPLSPHTSKKSRTSKESGGESCEQRKEKFKELIDRFERNEDPIHQHMATLMISFLAGLFVGTGKFEEIKDNLDLERWFRLPKSHERGPRSSPRGDRIVQDGPTLALALDAHVVHPGFPADDLLPYRTAREPPCQRERHEPTQDYEESTLEEERPILLAELERRYREATNV